MLEEKRARALVGGGQQRVDKQHKNVRKEAMLIEHWGMHDPLCGYGVWNPLCVYEAEGGRGAGGTGLHAGFWMVVRCTFLQKCL